MDIKELDKRQMVLLTLLITFVVSIATGIVTVSLMNQAPKSVPYTVNNVIQRTIEKVSTVSSISSSDTVDKKENQKEEESSNSYGGDINIKIYRGDSIEESKLQGEGVLISDSGLIIADSSILNGDDKYTISLDSKLFDLKFVKKFNNGLSILQIAEKVKNSEEPKEENNESLPKPSDSSIVLPISNPTQ